MLYFFLLYIFCLADCLAVLHLKEKKETDDRAELI